MFYGENNTFVKLSTVFFYAKVEYNTRRKCGERGISGVGWISEPIRNAKNDPAKR